MALTMNAGGRELLFRFTVRAWVEIEEKLGSSSSSSSSGGKYCTQASSRSPVP